MLVFTDNLRWLIIWSLVSGGVLCLAYDVIRASRLFLGISPQVEKMKGKRLFILKAAYLFFTDLTFCIVVAVSVLLLAYYTNGGNFRGLLLLGMALGFLIIRLTLSRLFTFILFRAVIFARKLIAWLVRLLLRVLAKIAKPLFSLYHLTLGRFVCIIKDRVRKNGRRAKP